jgi:competence ComEA-like helix-hairpin-helix protein
MLMPRSLQAVVALFAATGLLMLAFWFVNADGFSGGLIPYEDRQTMLPVRNSTGYSVDINTASTAELLQLPRVGPALANRIVERRETVGPFASIDDLLAVPGIGEITLADLRPFLRPISSVPTPKAGAPSTDSPDDVRTGQ